MRWRKLGLVYAPDGRQPWSKSHAIAPTPILGKDGSTIKVFFSSCDREMVGRIGWVAIDSDNPTSILDRADVPALDAGAPGCFDDNGVSVTSLVEVGDELRMYYFGFQLGVKVRYQLFSGLAVSTDGGRSFVRLSETPILERRDGERFVRSAPFVLRDNDGRFRMWYVSGNEFVDLEGKEVPRYGIRYLDSDDGLVWNGSGLSVMTPTGDDEYGFGRPFVIRTPEGYRMWYSVRSRSNWYRIGLADSRDGIEWHRRDVDVGIDVSSAGWDSGIVCYASIIRCGQKTLMFYNGNDYGRAGFGVAVLE